MCVHEHAAYHVLSNAVSEKSELIEAAISPFVKVAVRYTVCKLRKEIKNRPNLKN